MGRRGGGNRQFGGGRNNKRPLDNDSQDQDQQQRMDRFKSPKPRAGHESNSQGPTPSISRAPTPPLSEAVPQDTPRFAELTGSSAISPILVNTITEDLKFDHMMPVQAATLHELLPPSRNDCLVQAKTGTGKTIAFLLPALQTMISRPKTAGKSGVSLLVISPTRELAMQIAKEAKGLLQRLPNFSVKIAIGGTNKDKEERDILSGADILIATPGRLLDHLNNSDVKGAMHQLDTLVLDEADRLLDMGFLRDLQKIIGQLPDKKQTNRQGMLFSATIAPHVEQVASLVCADNYKFISTIPKGEANTHERVAQTLITAPTFALVAPALVAAIKDEGQKVNTTSYKAIVFATTAAVADFYERVLSGFTGEIPPASVLHSRMSQSKRTKITNDFRASKSAILVATDVIARGMDFPGVTTVFQVGLPMDKESYIHRLGRTARAGAEGRGVLIVAEAESFFPQRNLKEIPFTIQPADLSAADRVFDIASRMDQSEKSKVYQAWLGYYKTSTKPMRWDTTELVNQANIFARDALGSPTTPTLNKSTVGKMGLKGVKGIVAVPDPPREGRGQGGGGPRGGNGKQGNARQR